MSKKILRPLLSIAAVGLTIFGGPLGLGTIAALGLKIGGGALAGIALGIGSALLLRPKVPRVSPNATDRLTVTLDPGAPRKIAFGHTALATDCRYQGYSGSDQEYVEWIVAVASHTCEAIEEIWFDSTKAWSASGGVTSTYSGYLTVETRNPGTSGNGISIDSVWTSTCTLTGCAYVHLKFKVTGNSKKAESPFSSAIPTRVTIRGRAALLPDLREDGVDPDDQTTWDWFSDDSGRNPAWQLLFYLLGWRINGKLAVGRGIPSDRIDLDSFITAANLCDEPVTKAGGGTEPRYRSDALFSEADDPSLVIGCLCDAMNAVIRDSGGKIGVYVLHNDLATPVCAFTEADIIGDDEWQQTPPIDQTVNITRGRYVDASDAGLYQLVDYPDVELESVDGIDRIDPFDLPCVQSASQAQRLAKQRLQRSQYRGVFQAKFNYRAWQVNLGDVVTLSHSALGWEDKLFRVAGTSVGLNGVVDLILREENEAIYAWDAEESAPVTPAVPTAYDPTKSAFNQALDEIELTPGPQGDPGPPGADGLNNAIVYLYRRASSTPSGPSGTFTYTFATGVLSGGTLNGWTQAIPAADGNPLWTIAATASSTGATDSIAATEFTSPVVMAQDGASLFTLVAHDGGVTVTPNSISTVGSLPDWLYSAYTLESYVGDVMVVGRVAAAADMFIGLSTAPGGSSYTSMAYAYLAGGLRGTSEVYESGSLVAFIGAEPAVGDFVYVRRRVTGPTSAQVEYGVLGETAPRHVTTGVDPSVPLILDTSILGTGGPWTPAWDQIAFGPVGADGAAGSDGLNSATVFLFQRAASPPSVPGSTLTYTFATGVLSGTLGSWTQAVPPHDGNPLYVITATALSAGPTDTIAPGEWASPQIHAEDGISPVLVTANPATLVVKLNADGSVASGELPATVEFAAVRAGAAVTVTSVSVASASGCMASVSSLVGQVTALSGTSGQVVFSVTADGDVTDVTVPFSTAPAGTSGGTSATKACSLPSSTSYADISSGGIAINADASGALSVNLTGFLRAANGSGNERQIVTKIQVSTTGGSSWTDVSGSEHTSEDSVADVEPPYIANKAGLNGSGPYSVTGLGANTACLVRAMGKNVATPTGGASATITLYAGQP